MSSLDTEEWRKKRSKLLELYGKNAPPIETVLEERGEWRVTRIAFTGFTIFRISWVGWYGSFLQSVLVNPDEVLICPSEGARPIPRWCWEVLTKAVALEPTFGSGEVAP